jgi:hypothetical protein
MRAWAQRWILLWATAFPAAAQGLSVAGHRIDLPKGGVIQAAFLEQSDSIIVEQRVQLGEGFPGEYLFRVSVWRLNGGAELARREFKDNSLCGIVVAGGRVYLCNQGKGFEIVDPSSLATVGSLPVCSSGFVHDFAVDAERGRIFVALSHSDRSVSLAACSAQSGARFQEASLDVNREWDHVHLDLEPVSGRVVISGIGKLNSLTLCEMTTGLQCRALGKRTDAGGQIAFLGRQLLTVSNYAFLLWSRSECIKVLNPENGVTNAKAYCSPSTGVHHAVGVVLQDYVVGFTGTTQHHAWGEYLTSIQSSFSVWRAENPKVAAVVHDPTDYGGEQAALRIVGSKTAPRFMTFSRSINELWAYSIQDPERNRAGR